MATPTLTQLLTPQTNAQIMQQLLNAAQGNGLPVTDWAVGGVMRTLMQMVADAIYDESGTLIPQIAGGGFVDYATGTSSGSPGDWLGLLAQQVYSLTRIAATSTLGNVLLSNSSGSAYTIQPGQLWITGPTGNQYNTTSGGTLNAGGTLSIAVQSATVNNSLAGQNYTDGPNTLTTLITPLPGVTVNNPAPDFSSVAQVGTGTGTITLSRTTGGTPPTPANVTILINTSGAVGVATYSYSINGAAYVSLGTTAASAALASTGTTVALSGTFTANDTYSWSSPGSWMTQPGANQETDASLAARMKARWPSLSGVPTANVYALWAKQASASVTSVYVTPDATVPGQVDVMVAGQAGTLPGGTIAAVQTYIQQRAPITDKVNVISPVNLNVTIAGTVTVQAKYLTTQQAATAQNVGAYVSSQAIGPTTIYYSDIIEMIMIPPVGQPQAIINAAGVTVNGVAGDLAVPFGQVAVVPNLAGLTWISV
jgi:uncharacterized phage protein gp47/JayE